MRSHFATTAAPATPTRVPGALWQAGVTPGNASQKVLLDGEPVVAAVAAGEGWVLVQPEPELVNVKPGRHAPLGLAYRVGPFDGLRRLEGDVQIVPVAGTRRRVPVR